MQRALLIGLLAVLPGTPMLAQFASRGSITGTVSDSSGAVVAEVQVRATDLDRNQTISTRSNNTGVYTFNNLTPGRYQLTVEHPGFRKLMSTEIAVDTQTTAKMDLMLQVGQVTDSIEIRAAAPQIETGHSQIGQVIDQAYIASLPVMGRNFTSLTALSPNISTAPRANSKVNSWTTGAEHLVGGVDFTPGGGGSKGFYVNNVNINDNWMNSVAYAPAVDSIAEVKIESAGFSAENGRDVSTIQVFTKGGGAAYHGALYDYLQNNAVNALNAYSKATGATKNSFLQRNQYGFNLGGPASIPKLFQSRDRAFFFFNYEGMRQNTGGNNATFRVPSLRNRQGDFGDLLERFPADRNYIIYDPYSTQVIADGPNKGKTSRTPVPGNDLRKIGRVNPLTQGLVALFPEPNGYVNPADPKSTLNYMGYQASRFKSYRLDARGDVRISDRDNVYVMISKSRGTDDKRGGLFPAFQPNTGDASMLFMANYARTFSATLANELVISRRRAELVSIDTTNLAYLQQIDTARAKAVKNAGDGFGAGVWGLSIDNWAQSRYGSIGATEYFTSANPALTISDNLSWIHGRHSFKFGFTYLRVNENSQAMNRGIGVDTTFTSEGSCQFLTGSNCTGGLGGDSVASLLIGIPTWMNQMPSVTNGEPVTDTAMPYYGGFVEDRFQLRPNLTLSLGLRYDLYVPNYSANGNGYAVVDFGYPNWQLKIPGLASGVPLHSVRVDKNNFAPRISIAYGSANSFVVRASYGLFYDMGVGTVAGGMLDDKGSAVPGVSATFYNNNSAGVHPEVPYYGWSNVFPAAQTVSLGVYPISTAAGAGYFADKRSIKYHDAASGLAPYQHKFAFEFQKEVLPETVLTLSYLGSQGRKGLYYENVNIPAYMTGWSSSAYEAARPSSRYGDVQVPRFGLNSFYNSATFKLERRLRNSFQILSFYTFSKTVADRTGWFWNRYLSRGEAQFSHPHRFVLAPVFETPWGKSLPKLARSALHGWKLSGIVTLESGDALSATNSVTNANDKEPNVPNLSGNPNLPRGQRTMFQYFDTSVFNAPTSNTKGTAGQGIIRGPGQNRWDISMFKAFHPVEKAYVEFRCDMFNALNHTQWSTLDTTLRSGSANKFGRVTGARDPRILQFGLKIGF